MTEATGEDRLDAVGGLARRMPLLAAGSGVAAAALAALPLTLGFFKDELFFKAALERGPAVAALAVAGAALTFAYVGRFWAGLFLGTARTAPDPVERRLTWPVAFLALLLLVGGVAVGPFAALAEDAAAATAGAPAPVDAAYHLDARAENLMALGAYAAGLLLLAGSRILGVLGTALHAAGRVLGPERAYEDGLALLNRISDRMHAIEVRDLRGRVAAVLVPGGLLVIAGVFLTPTEGAYAVGTLTRSDIPLVLGLGLVALSAVAATLPRRHTALALVLSAVGFGLAVTYALVGGADVALVAVLVETLFALLFFGVYALLPREVLEREARLEEAGSRRWRDPVIGIGSGIAAFLVVWGVLSQPTPQDPTAARQIELTESAHAKDVVTAILADFRGLDTLVEVTVVAVAVLAVTTLLRARRATA